ncbi:acyltransferase family protein [Zestomonas insulae]|nr:acyltransferase family protein [Pseudomonas insulae]
MVAAQSKGFRADINGLRAWAVVAVVLYHFGVPGLQGGFVGVDVFFVISGYLMTGIILSALQAGHFSLGQFYWARARRIVPALLVLCAVLLLAGWFVLLSEEYQTLGRHVRDSLLFTSNLRYLKESGYFDSGAHEKWLLHTWSLSVEWQFYLLLPLVLLALWRLFSDRRALFLGLLAMFAGSLLWCVILTARQPEAAFFVLTARAWELLAGSLVFLLAGVLGLSDLLRRRLSWLGLGLIVMAVLGYSPETSWPGWRALLPVCGAGLVLLAQRSNSRWTTSGVAQWMGDRSYSLYLWHWPVVVALAYLELLASPAWIAAGIGLSLLLGHASYQLVEVTSRRALAQADWRRGLVALLGGVLVVTLAAQWVRKAELPGRLPEAVREIEAFGQAGNPRREECLEAGAECVYGGPRLRAIVLGDSHADAVVTAVAASLPTPADGLLFKGESGCLIMQGARPLDDDADCLALNRWVAEQLPQTLPGQPVILINRLASYAFGGLPGEEDNPVDRPRVYFQARYARPTEAFRAEFRAAYLATACRISRSHPLYLLRPIPEMPLNVPVTLARARLRGESREVKLPIEAYRQRQAFLWGVQDEAVERCGARILDPLPYLCDQQECLGSMQGLPLYIDDDHLNEQGGRRLMPLFEPLFRKTD